MNKQNFEKLEKVKELLDELKMSEFMAPLLVGDQIMEIINDLHNDPEQFGVQVFLPSPDGDYNFVVRVCREENLEDRVNENEGRIMAENKTGMMTLPIDYANRALAKEEILDELVKREIVDVDLLIELAEDNPFWMSALNFNRGTK